MQIIREGKLPEEEVRQAACRKCHTLFEFKVGEARETSDRNESFLIVTCPLPGCKEQLWLPRYQKVERPTFRHESQWDR